MFLLSIVTIFFDNKEHRNDMINGEILVTPQIKETYYD